jgi:hypothetical protein
MEKKIITKNNVIIAVIKADELVIKDTQSALDLIATLDYYDQCQGIILYKENIIEAFFNLSTGIAGEVLQKFVTYSKKLAIVGDFSMYESQALKDFIYECNQGNHIYFVADEKTGVEKLSK